MFSLLVAIKASGEGDLVGRRPAVVNRPVDPDSRQAEIFVRLIGSFAVHPIEKPGVPELSRSAFDDSESARFKRAIADRVSKPTVGDVLDNVATKKRRDDEEKAKQRPTNPSPHRIGSLREGSNP
jgi:CubicO group peptidase (beta-lactamase class C family)